MVRNKKESEVEIMGSDDRVENNVNSVTEF